MSQSAGLSHRPTASRIPDESNGRPAEITQDDIQFVIRVDKDNADERKSTDFNARLLATLDAAGLRGQVEEEDQKHDLVLVAVKAPEYLYTAIFRARVREWVCGARQAAPHKDIPRELRERPIDEAEELRTVFNMLTLPPAEGGAGITAGIGPWKQIDSIFPLHDEKENKRLLGMYFNSSTPDPLGLNLIRARFGESVALYFAFGRTYSQFLAVPALVGLVAAYFVGSYSYVYAVVNGLWCVIFTEFWRQYQVELAASWGVKGVSEMVRRRPQFEPDSIATSKVGNSDYSTPTFSPYKRLLRQSLQVPFLLISTVLLSSVIACCFAIEIFITELYKGPGQSVLVFLPTGLVTIGLMVAKNITMSAARRLTNYENYETDAAYEAALTSKLLVVDFVTSYLPICLTAFVYVPFAGAIVPRLDVFSVTAKYGIQAVIGDGKEVDAAGMIINLPQFEINPNRLQKQVLYFTGTAQVVHFFVSFVLPVVRRKGALKLKNLQNIMSPSQSPVTDKHGQADKPSKLVQQAQEEAKLEIYNPADDLREMVIQFGYLSLFSVVWPLTGLFFWVNNWLEIRADVRKLCVDMRRPVPVQAEGIGPWMDALSLIGWMGSMISACLMYMFSNDGLGPGGTPSEISTWALAVTVLLAEHLHFLAQAIARAFISKLDIRGRKSREGEKMNAEREFLKKRELGEPDSLHDMITLRSRQADGSMPITTRQEPTASR